MRNSAKSIHTRKPKKAGADGFEPFGGAKSIRYRLQQQAGRILYDYTAGKRQKFRVCHCSRSIQGEVVQVFRQEDGRRARFGGLTTCGSGWTCPVCAGRIGEVRRAELSAMLVSHVASGGRVNLTTMTFPHELDQPLAELMEKFAKARQKFKNSRTYKNLFTPKDTKIGCIGCASSLEITRGKNGWHPHLHMLSFTDRSLTDSEILALKKAWVGALLKVGLGDGSKLTDMMEHALDVRGGEDAAAYIAKYGREEQWGITSELTRSHSKKGIHEDSLTPFGMLALADAGDTEAAALFKEFAECFLGKRLVTFSPGLRKHFGLNVDNETDEEAAVAPGEAELFVGSLQQDQWRAVLRADARAELLSYAAEFCHNPDTAQDDLNDFVASLGERKPVSRGWFVSPMRPPAPFGRVIF